MIVATTQDRDARAADVGMWLFVASLVMFYGALFSGYVLLRVGSETWTTPWQSVRREWEIIPFHWQSAIWLAIAMALTRRWRVGVSRAVGRPPGMLPVAAAVAAALFAMSWMISARAMAQAGHGPATGVAAASWFVITGAVAVLALAGAFATGWVGVRHRVEPPSAPTTLQVERFWRLMLAFWLAVVVGFYLV